MVTKSGTSRFSGEAYEFLRNDQLNANSFFRNMNPGRRSTGTAPRLRHRFRLHGGRASAARPPSSSSSLSEGGRVHKHRRFGGSRPGMADGSASPNYVPPEARDPNCKLLPYGKLECCRNQHLSVMTTNDLDTRQGFIRGDDSLDELGARWRYPRSRHARGEGLTMAGLTRPIASWSATRVVKARRAAGESCSISLPVVNSELSRRARGTRERIQIPELFPENAANVIPFVGRPAWP